MMRKEVINGQEIEYTIRSKFYRGFTHKRGYTTFAIPLTYTEARKEVEDHLKMLEGPQGLEKRL